MKTWGTWEKIEKMNFFLGLTGVGDHLQNKICLFFVWKRKHREKIVNTGETLGI